MPLTWLQVRSGLDPRRYTLRTVPGLLAESEGLEGLRRGRPPDATPRVVTR